MKEEREKLVIGTALSFGSCWGMFEVEGTLGELKAVTEWGNYELL
jgi:hypothetical protein